MNHDARTFVKNGRSEREGANGTRCAKRRAGANRGFSFGHERLQFEIGDGKCRRKPISQPYGNGHPDRIGNVADESSNTAARKLRRRLWPDKKHTAKTCSLS
jgi:hypothetical protein